MSGTILEIKQLRKTFGGLAAVDDVNFTVAEGQIKSIIGPNGAGKTTVFNIIAGAFPPTSGSVTFKGRSIAGFKSYAIARLGIARTFQNVKIFGNMTALENVMLGRHCRTRTGFAGACLRLPHAMKEEKKIHADSLKHLEFVGLADMAGTHASGMAFGQQKTLEIARALATDPAILLLDEPAAGLNTRETEEIAGLIQRIRDTGVTVLLVEHDMELVMNISDEVMVMDFGKKLAEGTPREVQNNPEVVRVYLGVDFEPDKKQ
jgi:branched-chain amino acid transport system ATP-binding protein